MSVKNNETRRVFLQRTTVMAGGMIAAGAATASLPSWSFAAEDEDIKISPTEDLMREHGVLKRVLLVYDEIGQRLTAGKEVQPKVLTGAAEIIKDFIEQYHEMSEEDHLFPRFEKAGTLRDLVSVLREQHDRGRSLTAAILKGADTLGRQNTEATKRLVDYLRQFVRMYSPHEAREDTILFPAFQKLLSRAEFDDLGEQFENKEQQMFGKDGFASYVKKVADIERSLGIYELSQFTPTLK